jgi:hypothetical protein
VGRSFGDLELPVVDAVPDVTSDPSSVNFVSVDLSSAELLHQRLRIHRSFLASEVARLKKESALDRVGVADDKLLVGWLVSLRGFRLPITVFLVVCSGLLRVHNLFLHDSFLLWFQRSNRGERRLCRLETRLTRGNFWRTSSEVR